MDILASDLVSGMTIVGDAGGYSTITGEIFESSVVTGTLAVETEHGTLYLEPDETVTTLA